LPKKHGDLLAAMNAKLNKPIDTDNGMDAPFPNRHRGAKVEMGSIHLNGKERPR
jgi:hypothetical protein